MVRLPKFTSLVVRSTPKGNPVALKVQRAVADYVGWSAQYDTYSAWVMANRPQAPGGGWHFSPSMDPSIGGQRYHLILRKDDWDLKGEKRVAFRTTKGFKLRDLAELGHFVKVDWEAIKRIGGPRYERKDLEALYQSP